MSMSGAGAAAGVVGGFMQSVAATMESRAMFQAFQAELARQHGYNDQAYGAFQQSLPGQGSEAAQTQIGAGQTQRESDYGQLENSSLLAGGGGQAGGSATDKAALQLSGAARARVGGYGDWKVNQMIDSIRTKDTLDKISNFAGGTASVFPYRMYAAQHSQDELDMWGKAISSIGGGSFSPSASAPSMGAPSGGQMQNAMVGSGVGYDGSNGQGGTWNSQPMFNPGSYSAPNVDNISGIA